MANRGRAGITIDILAQASCSNIYIGFSVNAKWIDRYLVHMQGLFASYPRQPSSQVNDKNRLGTEVTIKNSISYIIIIFNLPVDL